MAKSIMRELALPNSLVSSTRMLVRLHDHVVKPTARSVRRTLSKFERACPGEAPPSPSLLDLKRADAVSRPRGGRYVAGSTTGSPSASAARSGRAPSGMRTSPSPVRTS